MSKANERASTEELPKQRIAPTRIKQQVYGRNIRKEIIDKLDADNPEFVHMYQHPGLVTGDAKIAWEAESKGQELVKDEQGRIIHHMGDPVVRVRRDEFESEREFEAELSRKDVEAVVKPSKSTVKRNRKTPVEQESK